MRQRPFKLPQGFRFIKEKNVIWDDLKLKRWKTQFFMPKA